MEQPVSTSDLEEAVELWQSRGWVLVDGLVPTDDINAAIEPDLWEMYPRPEEFQGQNAVAVLEFERGHSDSPQVEADEKGQAFRTRQFLGHRLMPYPGTGRLNRLTVHPNVVSFAKQAMGDDDLRIYQTRIWGKYTGVTNYSQPFHQDRNHNIVPDRLEPGWWNLEGFLYLSDVEDGVAPTQVHGTGSRPGPRRGSACIGCQRQLSRVQTRCVASRRRPDQRRRFSFSDEHLVQARGPRLDWLRQPAAVLESGHVVQVRGVMHPR